MFSDAPTNHTDPSGRESPYELTPEGRSPDKDFRVGEIIDRLIATKLQGRNQKELVTVWELKKLVDNMKEKDVDLIYALGIESRKEKATPIGSPAKLIKTAGKLTQYEFKYTPTLPAQVAGKHAQRSIGVFEINEHAEPFGTEGNLGINWRDFIGKDAETLKREMPIAANKSAKQFGASVKANLKFADGGFIILNACNSGLLKDSWVQQIAKEAGVPVYAPLGLTSGAYLLGQEVKVRSFGWDGTTTYFGYYPPGTKKIQFIQNDIWNSSTNGLYRKFSPYYLGNNDSHLIAGQLVGSWLQLA